MQRWIMEKTEEHFQEAVEENKMHFRAVDPDGDGRRQSFLAPCVKLPPMGWGVGPPCGPWKGARRDWLGFAFGVLNHKVCKQAPLSCHTKLWDVEKGPWVPVCVV